MAVIRFLKWLFSRKQTKGEKPKFFKPSEVGIANKPCDWCGRWPDPYEGFSMWHGRVTCSHCFWSDEWFDTYHGSSESE